jgi:hypothetical protein
MERCRQHPGGGIKIEMNSILNKILGLTPLRWRGEKNEMNSTLNKPFGDRFRVKSIFALAIALLTTSAVLAQDLNTLSPVDSFKNFLQECPNVKSFVMEKRLLSVPNIPIPGEKLPDSITNEFKFYEGAWQTNAFYLRELRNIKDQGTVIDTNTFTEDLLIEGRNNIRWWDIINTQITSWWPATNERLSSISSKVIVAESILCTALHLGIHDLKPRTLLWRGNHFSAQTIGGKMMEGELFVSNGLPHSLTVQYPDKKSFSYVCEYEYKSPVLSAMPLPSTIRRYSVRNGVKTPAWLANIVTIEIANVELPTAHFDPERFVVRTQAKMYVITNNLEYKVLTNKLLKLPSSPAPVPIKPAIDPKAARILTLSLLAATTIGVTITVMVIGKRK